jgi:hypothetical protein
VAGSHLPVTHFHLKYFRFQDKRWKCKIDNYLILKSCTQYAEQSRIWINWKRCRFLSILPPHSILFLFSLNLNFNEICKLYFMIIALMEIYQLNSLSSNAQYLTNWIGKSSSFIPISKYFSFKCLKSQLREMIFWSR